MIADKKEFYGGFALLVGFFVVLLVGVRHAHAIERFAFGWDIFPDGYTLTAADGPRLADTTLYVPAGRTVTFGPGALVNLDVEEPLVKFFQL